MMLSVDRERVFEATFLRSAGNKADLIRRLNTFIERLKKLNMDDDDISKELESNAPELISTLLDHSDPDVRTLSVCCIIAILKVIKESNEVPCLKDKVRIIEAVTSQIRKVSTCDIRSEVGRRLDYILSSVGTIMWEVLFNSAIVPGVENLFPSFVDAVISAFKEEHADRGECLDAVMRMNIFSVIHA
jgi:hypothetical protein